MSVPNHPSIVIGRQSSVGCGASPATGDRRLTTESGVILIALLWILTALSVIAFSFSRETFVEVAAARNAQSLEDSYFVARAGIASTVYQLMLKRNTASLKQVELQETPDPIDLGVVTGALGSAEYRVDLQDESGKLPINSVNEEQLRNLIEACGIKKPDSDIIADSILDWRDADAAHRINGAENDYYQSLNPPYNAKNGRIDAIEELLLIRGITPEYFYGYPEKDANGSIVYKYGLSRCLTVYSNNPAQVNINFAPLAVLQSVPGMSPEAAKAIYDRRHTKPFKTTQDISRDLGISLDAKTLPYLGLNKTGFYTLTASAHAANSKVRRVIRCIINIDPVSNRQYRTLYWNENVPDYEGMTP
jgi:general secretion pathway protein K